MKIVLSRKGFDSGTGQVASPILPSGELCWLPIPESRPDSRSKRYAEILMGDHSLGAIVNNLTRGKITPETPAHLDPDLNFGSIPRLENTEADFWAGGCRPEASAKPGRESRRCFSFFWMVQAS